MLFINHVKDDENFYAVVKVDESVHQVIKAQGSKVYIGLSSCKVSQRYHLLQCYSCQEFGHKVGSEKCSLKNEEKVVCLYCAKNHSSKSCPHKKIKVCLNVITVPVRKMLQ